MLINNSKSKTSISLVSFVIIFQSGRAIPELRSLNDRDGTLATHNINLKQLRKDSSFLMRTHITRSLSLAKEML